MKKFLGVLDQSRVTLKLCISIDLLAQLCPTVLMLTSPKWMSLSQTPAQSKLAAGCMLGVGWVLEQWEGNDKTV